MFIVLISSDYFCHKTWIQIPSLVLLSKQRHRNLCLNRMSSISSGFLLVEASPPSSIPPSFPRPFVVFPLSYLHGYLRHWECGGTKECVQLLNQPGHTHTRMIHIHIHLRISDTQSYIPIQSNSICWHVGLVWVSRFTVKSERSFFSLQSSPTVLECMFSLS